MMTVFVCCDTCIYSGLGNGNECSKCSNHDNWVLDPNWNYKTAVPNFNINNMRSSGWEASTKTNTVDLEDHTIMEIDDIAQELGIDRSTVVKLAIRRYWREVFG